LSFRASSSGFSVQHSHTVTTFHPVFRRAFWVFISRVLFSLNLLSQNFFRLFGVYAYLQFLCRCQKQPCTNTIVRCFGRTISGLPGKSFRWSEKRNPIRCNAERTVFSGFVFLSRIRPIFQLRFPVVRLSVMISPAKILSEYHLVCNFAAVKKLVLNPDFAVAKSVIKM